MKLARLRTAALLACVMCTCHLPLAAAGLPNLWIPSPDSFFEVDEIPVLGSGKLDLGRLKKIAEEKVAAQGA